jgi:hypothetical protein
VPSKQSKPPASIKFSKAFLLAALKSMRLVKSNIDLYLPSFLFSTMVSTAPAPTPFTAPIPKRMAFLSFTVNLWKDSLTSGPKTSKPIRLHSSIKKVTCLISLMLLESTAAMYSAG